MDMSGAAAVLEAMGAIAELELPVNVARGHPLDREHAERHRDQAGRRDHPVNGKTVEVNNTDAEGRLILADALAYSVELGAERIVDLATLTGAVLIALGSTYAALISNDDELRRRGGGRRRRDRRTRLAPAAPRRVQGADQGHATPTSRTPQRSARRARSTPAPSSRSSSTGTPGPTWTSRAQPGTSAASTSARARPGSACGLPGRTCARVARLNSQQAQEPSGEGALPSSRTRRAASRASGCAAAGCAGSGTPLRRPRRVGTVAKWTMSGSRPEIARSGLRRSPSSTTTDPRAELTIRSGENSSAKRKTTRPRIRRRELGIARDPSLDQAEDARRDAVLDHPAQAHPRRRSVPRVHHTIVRMRYRSGPGPPR